MRAWGAACVVHLLVDGPSDGDSELKAPYGLHQQEQA